MIALLAFLNVEKNLDKEQAEIKERKGVVDSAEESN